MKQMCQKRKQVSSDKFEIIYVSICLLFSSAICSAHDITLWGKNIDKKSSNLKLHFLLKILNWIKYGILNIINRMYSKY